MAFLDRVLALPGRVRDFAGALDREGAIARALNLAQSRDLNVDLLAALKIAEVLADVLGLDRAAALNEARDLAKRLVGELASALDTSYPLHRQHALNRAATTARDLAQALNRAEGGAGGDYTPDPTDLDLARDLASALVYYHRLLSALASYPPVPGRDRDLARDPARDPDIVRCRDLAQYLAQLLDGQMGAEGSPPLPGRVRLAVWLLPGQWQARYCEEFRAELALLPRSEWRPYGKQVLKRAWRLRKELAGRECPPDDARAEG
ncbi:MAG: hypothetical protein JO281_13985 [Pseudonocardiales bacterium]|nr:hypothetical protein [Pseudonocardiales bacterium]